MYINTFKYRPEDVSCKLCTEYVKKLGCTSSSQSPLLSISADGENCAHFLAPPLPTKSATLRGPRTCPWLAERIEAGVVGYREAITETFPHDRRLSQRFSLLIKHFPGSLWGNVQHQRRMEFERAVQKYRYVTEYRVYKGSDWTDSEISLDLEDLVAELAAMCEPYYEHNQPVYEL